MNLNNENSEGAVFKILPRYKVKSVGDEVSLSTVLCMINAIISTIIHDCSVFKVHYDDQVKLESIKTPGQFLHASSFHRSLLMGSAGISIGQN